MNVTRYTEWYDQPANDPFQGNYANLFRSFDASVNPMDETGKDLLNSIANGRDPKTAFVILNSEGRIHVVHRIRTCMPTFGEPEAPHHGMVTAMCGDVSASGQFRFVEILSTAFALTDEFMNVRTPASIDLAIQAFPDAHQLVVDPLAPDVTVATIRTRFYMLIPPNLTGRVLEASMIDGGLTPRNLWKNFAGPLINDDTIGLDCAPFIDWCRLAYAHGIGTDNPLCQELPPALPSNSVLYPFRLEILNQDISFWELDARTDGVEHTVVAGRSRGALPLTVDVDSKKVFFGEIEILLPSFPDCRYLNDIMERVNHKNIVTRKKTLNEDALLALVQGATINTCEDWRVRRVARAANLPQENFNGVANCGEMFLQQTVYSPIFELFSCFDVSMYCADKKVECAHVVGCNINIPAGKRYQVSCKPDAALRLTEKFYVGTMMEIKPYDADEEALKFDKYKCLLMTCMSVLAIEEYLLESHKQTKQPVKKEFESHAAKRFRLTKSTKDDTKPEYGEIAIPFVLAEFNTATLYVTRVLKQTGCPEVSQLLSITFVNRSDDEKQRKSEFMAMLAILVADIFSFSKHHHHGMKSFFSGIRTSQTSLPLENALSQTKSSNKTEPKSGDVHSTTESTRHNKVLAKPSAHEDAAMQIAHWNGHVKDLDYAFPRTQTLCLDDDSSGQRDQWEADMKYFQQESPYYFKGFYHSRAVFCKVWRKGDSRTSHQNVKDEIMYHQKANEFGIPSPKVIKELTAMDIRYSTHPNKNVCTTMYHVLVTEYHNDCDVEEQDALKYAVQLVKAVSSLHKIGILHCDIKPRNILWNAKEKVLRLIDFGHAQELIKAQSYHATQKYEAPEISEKYPHSQMTEAYAVGKTLEKVVENFKSPDAEKIRKLATSLQSVLPLRLSLEYAEALLTSMENGNSTATLNCNLENIVNEQHVVRRLGNDETNGNYKSNGNDESNHN